MESMMEYGANKDKAELRILAGGKAEGKYVKTRFSADKAGGDHIFRVTAEVNY